MRRTGGWRKKAKEATTKSLVDEELTAGLPKTSSTVQLGIRAVKATGLGSSAVGRCKGVGSRVWYSSGSNQWSRARKNKM